MWAGVSSFIGKVFVDVYIFYELKEPLSNKKNKKKYEPHVKLNFRYSSCKSGNLEKSTHGQTNVQFPTYVCWKL